jgi:hypothetical protein
MAAVLPVAGTSVARKQRFDDTQLPDFGDIREQLQRHRHLTLQLVWEELWFDEAFADVAPFGATSIYR